MAVNERDLRMVIVAFEDAVTWCETLADVMETMIASVGSQRPLDEGALQSAVTQLAGTRRFLRADRSEVQRIKERAGIV